MAGIMEQLPAPTGELFEKPKPLKIGKVFKQKVVVQHRSDMLLKEQIENVQNVQDALKSSLQELETSKNPEEIQFLEQQVSDLKEKCDQMIVVLKIVQKMNTELQYARSDLQKKLKLNESDSDEINRTRKRVGWLEDRMEQVLGKKRQRSAHRAVSLVADPRSMLHSDRNRGDRGGYMSDYSSYVPRDHSPRSSTNSPLHRATAHHLTDDSEMSYPLQLQPKVADIQKDIFEDESKPNTSHASHGYHQRKHRDSDEENTPPSFREEKTFITQYPDTPYSESRDTPEMPSTASPVKTTQKQLSPQDVPLLPPIGHSYQEPPLGTEMGTSSEIQSSDEPGTVPAIEVDITRRPLQQQEHIPAPPSDDLSASSSERKEKREEESSETATTSEDTNRTSEGEGGPTQGLLPLLAEEEMPKGIIKSKKAPSKLSKEGSRVTILSPADELLAIEEPGEGRGDATDRYWQSEHHRFQYSEYVEDLVEMNPTSYHNMGLAVPGCFVDNVVDSVSKLPWRERSTSELSDVHKVALDKLSLKIHKMCGRVKEASMLSVRPEVADPNKKGPSLLLQALESSEDREKSNVSTGVRWGKARILAVADGPDTPSTIPAKPTLAKYGLMRPSSAEVSGFPVVNASAERLGTSMSGRLIYRPNPLPYPDKLPVTKLNRLKEYPPLSELYSKSIPGQDMAPDRIVDQRNLYNETKFTSSLFRSNGKNKRQVESPVEEVEVKAKEQPAEPPADEKKKKKRRKKHKTEYEPPGKPGIKGAFAMAKAAVKFRAIGEEAGQEKWSDMKPKSGALQHTGLKWERVKSIVHNSLISANADERIDAARHLGVMRVCDTMVLYALRERLKNDDEKRVVYESAKALITLGCWDEEALNVIVMYLLNGNTHIRADLVKTMIFAKNVQYINKKSSIFSDLIRILSVMCKVDKPEDRMSFDAAVCMGRMCIYDDNAKARLKLVVDNSTDTHMKAEALDILIRQMNNKSPQTVLVLVEQLTKSSVWKYRVDACKLLIKLGVKYATPDGIIGTQVYDALERKLWDDPSHNVRYEAARAMAALELFPFACEKVEKKLEDQNEEARAQAVISVGTLGMKNERILRHLMEMIDLDSSEYVRLMIIRSFITLHCIDKRILRILKDKERGEGILARESGKALEYLDSYAKLVEKKKRRKKQKLLSNSA